MRSDPRRAACPTSGPTPPTCNAPAPGFLDAPVTICNPSQQAEAACEGTVSFGILGRISHAETIAQGVGIRELPRLRRLYGPGNWRKRYLDTP